MDGRTDGQDAQTDRGKTIGFQPNPIGGALIIIVTSVKLYNFMSVVGKEIRLKFRFARAFFV